MPRKPSINKSIIKLELLAGWSRRLPRFFDTIIPSLDALTKLELQQHCFQEGRRGHGHPCAHQLTLGLQPQTLGPTGPFRVCLPEKSLLFVFPLCAGSVVTERPELHFVSASPPNHFEVDPVNNPALAAHHFVSLHHRTNPFPVLFYRVSHLSSFEILSLSPMPQRPLSINAHDNETD